MQIFWLDPVFLPPNQLPKPTLFPQMLKSVKLYFCRWKCFTHLCIDLSYLCMFTCPWRRNQVTNVKVKRASGELRNSSSAQICSKTIAPNDSAFSEVSATQTDLTLMKLGSIETVFFPVWVGVRKKARFRHLQPLSFALNVCGNQSDTAPGPSTFTFAHTGFKSYHFPHTFSLEVALSSGLQLQAGILTLRGQTGVYWCK